MDNFDEKDNALNNNDKSDAQSPNEEIPLWLQGIDEPENDETKPIEASNNPASTWVHEIEDQNLGPDKEDIADLAETVDPSDIEYETEIDLDGFDESKQLNNQEESLTDPFSQSSDEQENTEEIELHESTEDSDQEEIESDLDEIASVEGFVDISEVGLIAQPENTEDILDEDDLRQGELPEWLQEMIAESEEEPEEITPTPIIESEEEPVEVLHATGGELEINEIVQETSQDFSPLQEEPLDETFPQDEEVPSTGSAEELNFEQEYDLTIAEGDTTPVLLPSEDLHLSISDKELAINDEFSSGKDDEFFEAYLPNDQEEELVTELLSEENEPVDQALIAIDDKSVAKDDLSQEGKTTAEQVIKPTQDITVEEDSFTNEQEIASEISSAPDDSDPFQRAEQLLIQGQMSAALPIIKNMVENSDRLDQLEGLLKEKSDIESLENSETLEVLGDIALKQNKSEDAFQAYTKALKYLLESKETSDEIS